MKLKYETHKGNKINSRFSGFTTHDFLWFERDTQKWVTSPEPGAKGFSSHQDCNSVRAFRRKLKKLPKGVKFILLSKWVGYDVVGYGSV